ncbi:hypothetical protein GMDG_00321 [Pseudogymnoascus destructans 20631-21]|uniref:DUF7918 domain-containing protein n=1 Tax=Pseudogymnoascus destructans (strain ATCC MYA-4855 / 20631-21) TaxID=658429 RepID=L8G1M9_PSED2|nr:hypothetical protein GMDG_00321 [Pseudogymnoascus destructans 20631-21]
MPSCRGITLSITSALDSKVYPEFPHPETSQFQNSGSSALSGNNTKATSSLPSKEKPGNDAPDSSNPYASVYIPSLPGTRFVVQYSIDPPHRDGINVFLKLFMNGRHVTSWGIDPRTMPVGRAMLGLFEADKKLKSKALIPNPAETKPFYFNDQKRDVSAAENGGVIEVRVFRACGKRRRGAILDAFRGQDKYGIEFKSSGLLEKSRYKYFDWLLEDPKDDPFVTFRFHYRSWDSLEALQLVPEMCNRELLPAFSIKNSLSTPNLSGANPTLTRSGVICRFNKATANNGPERRNRSRTPGASLPNKKIENTIFGQMVAKDTALSQVQSKQAMQPDANKPKKNIRFPYRYSPPLTKKKPPAGQSHGRNLSASSMAFSIAPSLRSWADDDRSESPGPVLCVAAEVQVLHSPQLNQYGRKKSIFGDDSTTFSASDHNDPYGDIDQSFQFSLSAPPVYPKNNMSPVQRSPVKKPTARGLPLSTSAIFPPPAMRRDRMRRIRFKDQKRGCNSPTEGYEADHEGRNSYRGSGRPSTSGLPANMKLSQVPPRLLAVNSGFSFEFNNPCELEGGSEGNQKPKA